MTRLLVAIITLSAVPAMAADPPKVVRWEYKVVPIGGMIPPVKGDEKPLSITDALNKMGQDGWELVGVGPGVRTAQGADAGGFGGAAGGGGFGVGGLGGGGFGGTVGPVNNSERQKEQANLIWQSLARGQESVDLNAEPNARIKEMVLRIAGKIDDNVMTKEAFIKMMTERGQNVGRGGRGRTPPPELINSSGIAMWERYSNGLDSIDLNSPDHAAIKRRFESIDGYKVPENGKINKDEFLKANAQMIQQLNYTPNIVATGTSYYFKRPIP